MLADTGILMEALEIFAFGWGGIFIVMGIIYGAIKLLLKFFPLDE